MIADTSALVAVILGEPDAEAHLKAMAGAESLSVSAATLTEALIVLEARQGHEAAMDAIRPDSTSVTPSATRWR